MQNKHRALIAATALLYSGPLLAGLAGSGWAIAPVFAAIFLIWQIIHRPRLWPRDLTGWLTPEVAFKLAAYGCVQLALVAACLGLGRAIGALSDTAPRIPPGLSVAMSAFAVLLSRLVWNPSRAEAMDQFLDDAIRAINAGPFDPARAAQATALAHHLIKPLSEPSAQTDLPYLQSFLNTIATKVDDHHIRAALLARAKAGSASKAELTALILHATDGRLIEIVGGDGPTLALTALTALPRDPALIALFAQRLESALTEDCDLWDQCPTVELLSDLADDLRDTLAEPPLRALITATHNAAPPDFPAFMTPVAPVKASE